MANRRKAGEIRVLVVDYGPTRNLVMRYTCPITGRTVTRTSSTKNRKEALKEAGQWQAELQDGRYKPMSRATWEDLRLRYENEKMPEMEPGSAAGVSGKFDALERILNPNLLTELTIDRLELLKRTLAKETVTRKVGEETVEETIVRAPETVKGHMTVIMGALRWAKEHGLLREVPKLPKAKRVKGAKKMKGAAAAPPGVLPLAVQGREGPTGRGGRSVEAAVVGTLVERPAACRGRGHDVGRSEQDPRPAQRREIDPDHSRVPEERPAH